MTSRFSLWLALLKCRPSRALLGLAVKCRPSRALLGLAVASLAIVLFHAPLAHAKGPPPGRPPSAVTSPPPPGRTLSDRPPPPKKPLIALATDDGGRGPVVLTSHDGAYTGELRVTNEGAEALVVSRVAIRGDDEDVRAPARLSAHFGEGGGTTATIAPGAEKRVVVTWTPGRASRVRQVLAHVVVTSNDEEAGEVAIGVRAQLATPVPFIADHLLSWLTFLPLAGALLIVLLQIAGWGRGNSARAIALTATALQCLLAIGVASVFRGDVTRLDGNDGYQFIEHGDLGPLVQRRVLRRRRRDRASRWCSSRRSSRFVGVIASFSVDKQLKGYFAMYCLLVTGMMGVFVSLDLFLFYVFWEVMLLPMYFLIGDLGRAAQGVRGDQVLPLHARGSVFMLLAFISLYFNSDRTFLVDGDHRAPHVLDPGADARRVRGQAPDDPRRPVREGRLGASSSSGSRSRSRCSRSTPGCPTRTSRRRRRSASSSPPCSSRWARTASSASTSRSSRRRRGGRRGRSWRSAW